VLSAFEVGRAVARVPLPVPFVEPIDDLLARAEAIRETARLLEGDPESLEQLRR
jgi:hypothetical protein